MIKENTVVTVVCAAGEFIGKYKKNDTGNGSLMLEDPRMLVTGPEGNMGFARGICMTGVENPNTVEFNTYIFVTPSNDEVEKAYRKATSGIVIN